MKTEKVVIGNVGVDAGMIMICDPCYVSETKNHPIVDGDWMEFCEKFQASTARGEPSRMSLNYEAGHEGLGVVCDSGIGDGFYPVTAEIVDDPDWGRRIKSVTIDFLPHPYF